MYFLCPSLGTKNLTTIAGSDPSSLNFYLRAGKLLKLRFMEKQEDLVRMNTPHGMRNVYR